jgi:hypothetical protein
MSEEPYEARIHKGIQYHDSEFEHAMIRLWPDGRLCISRLNKRKDAWVFVRLATDNDVKRVKKMLSAKKNVFDLLGDK